MFNPWHVLGVNRQTSDDDVKAAYLKLMKKTHPDMKKGNSDKAAIINNAFAILKDKHNRSDFIKEMIVTNKECPACSGAGAKFKGKGFTDRVPVTCATCQGSGVVLKGSKK